MGGGGGKPTSSESASAHTPEYKVYLRSEITFRVAIGLGKGEVEVDLWYNRVKTAVKHKGERNKIKHQAKKQGAWWSE